MKRSASLDYVDPSQAWTTTQRNGSIWQRKGPQNLSWTGEDTLVM